jgi:hypothetical protein
MARGRRIASGPRWRGYALDVGRLAKCLTFCPDEMADLSMACYEDGGAMPLCDVGRLAIDCLSDQMGWMTCRWLVTKMAGLCPLCDVGRLATV